MRDPYIAINTNIKLANQVDIEEAAYYYEQLATGCNEHHNNIELVLNNVRRRQCFALNNWRLEVPGILQVLECTAR